MAILKCCPLTSVLAISVQPVGGVIVGTLLATSVADTDATITSLAAVPAGLLRLNDVTVLAPLLPLVELRNPMTGIAGQVSGTSQSFAAGRQTAPALPGAC